MANVVYDNTKKRFLQGALNLGSDSLKCALVSGYSPNVATDQYWSDVSANEISGTGYTAGGQALSGLTVAADTTNHRGTFTATNPSWASATISATGAVIYKDTGVAGTSPLICFIDFGGTKSSSAGTFTVVFDSTNKALYLG